VHFWPFLRYGKHLGNIVFESVHLPFHFTIFTRVRNWVHHQHADDTSCFIYQHKRWALTNTRTTEQTYQNSGHITKWLKKICMYFLKFLFHLVVMRSLEYCFKQYNITITRVSQKNNAYVVYVTKILSGIWHYNLQGLTDINIKMKLHVYTLQGKYEASKIRKLITYLKY
jgi:hypothetical protein